MRSRASSSATAISATCRAWSRTSTGDALSPGSLDRLRRLDLNTLPLVSKASPRVGACVGNVGKVLAIGLNYRKHAEEAGMPIPAEPIFFIKATSSICGPNDDVIIPQAALQKTDYEVELAIVIGTKASYVDVQDAKKHIAGYCVVNDVSEREYQTGTPGGQWTKGKSCDTFTARWGRGWSPRTRCPTPASCR